MADKSVILKDNDSNNLYPITLTDNVYTSSNESLTSVLSGKQANLKALTIQPSVTRQGQNDTVIQYRADTASWYRIWASGWKECGGYYNGGGGANSYGQHEIIFPLPSNKGFTKTNYTVLITPWSVTTCNWDYGFYVKEFTTEGFMAGTRTGDSFRWYACGY